MALQGGPEAVEPPSGSIRRRDDEAPPSCERGASKAAARPLDYEACDDRLNHNVFRYPAKFHPPVARKLIELFSRPADRVLDPFCGSGTTLIEANVTGRSAIGTDVDPLAVFVTQAKIRRYDRVAVEAAIETLKTQVAALRVEDERRWGDFLKDAPAEDVATLMDQHGLAAPAIPRIDHWFRHRVRHQLASMKALIHRQEREDVRVFLTLCLGAIVRGSSNADPVPVSGLEVTRHMLDKEKAGRAIDPYRLFVKALDRIAEATWRFAATRDATATAQAAISDARDLSAEEAGTADAVVTSPPYLTAVDYYRRHTLEMYWLDLTTTVEDRLEIMPRYIGRDRIGLKHLPDPDQARANDVAARWLATFDAKPERERAFRHYCDGMARAFARMADLVKPGGKVVVVAGDVTFCGRKVSMVPLMTDLVDPRLQMADHLWYAIKNRYMSYARKNEADIAADHVIVFERRG